MDPQTVDLGFILRQFKNYNFSMNSFQDRLHLQKFIYLLQAHDIYLGYDYSWYVCGPYSTTLAERGFELDTIYKDIPQTDTKFAYPTIQERFNNFKEFIAGSENNMEFLEIISSLHFLLVRGNTIEKAVLKVSNEHNMNFTYKECMKIIDMMVIPLLQNTGMINKTNINNIKSIINTTTDNYKIKYQYTDKVIYDMLIHAKGLHPEMCENRTFRIDQANPKVDTLIVDNAVAISLLTQD